MIGMIASHYVAAAPGGGGTMSLRSSSLSQVSAGSITVTFPAGATAGDLLLIFVHGNYAPVATPPSGWAYANRLTGSFFNGAVLTKIATSGDISTGSVAISMEGSEPVSAVCFAIADPGDYLLTLPFAARYGGNPGANPVSPAFDAAAGDILLYGAALRATTIPDISRGVTTQSAGGQPGTRATAETLASGLTGATVTYSNTASSGAYFVAAKIMPRPAPSLTAYSNAVIADGQLAYYRLDEVAAKTGVTALDISGNKRDAVYVGAPTLGDTGLLAGDTNKAVRFGSGKYLQLPTTTTWDVDTITIGTRALLRTSGVNQDLVKRDDGSTNRAFIFRISTSNKLELVFWDSTNTEHQFAGATALSNGSTYSLAAKLDGATVKLLVNGVVDGTLSLARTLRRLGNGTPVQVGGNVDLTLDEVFIKGAALSDSRLATYHSIATTGA